MVTLEVVWMVVCSMDLFNDAPVKDARRSDYEFVSSRIVGRFGTVAFSGNEIRRVAAQGRSADGRLEAL
jgi:hypothetical protein